MNKNEATCFCGTRHERAICRDCGRLLMKHDEPGLMGWFAYSISTATYSDGECHRNAMNGFHRAGWPLDSGLKASAVPA